MTGMILFQGLPHFVFGAWTDSENDWYSSLFLLKDLFSCANKREIFFNQILVWKLLCFF